MVEMKRRALGAVLLLALAWPVAAQVEKNRAPVAAPTVHWVTPWREGMELRYATDDHDLSVGEGGRESSRTTSIETLRITEAREDGFVQEWSFADTRYEQLEGGEGQAAVMQRMMDSLADLRLEVDLDAAGNYAGLRNLDAVAGRMRPVLRESFLDLFAAGFEAGVGEGEGGAATTAAAGEEAIAFVDGMVERMTDPVILGVLLSRDVAMFNDAFDAELEIDTPYEVDVEIDNPIGGGVLPARVSLLVHLGEPGSDDAVLAWTTHMDREKAAEIALRAAGTMYGIDLPEEARRQVMESMSIIDEGRVLFRVSTGVPEVFESTRTVRAAGELRVERRRMRLLDGDHDHAWSGDGTPVAAKEPAAAG